MPKIERFGTHATITAPNRVAIANRIKPVRSTSLGRLRVSLYGEPKTGKTTLFSTFPTPSLIIGSEDGTESILGKKGIDFVLLESTAEFVDLINGPIKAGKYVSVALDTATKFRELRVAEILGLDDIPIQKSWGFASREVWIQCSTEIKRFLKMFLDLPRLLPVNVVVISQEQAFGDGEEGGGSGLIRPSVGSAIGKSCNDWLNAECDHVLQALVRKQVVTTEVTMAGKKVKQTKHTGVSEFCLRLKRDEVYYAALRTPHPYPEFLANPSYDKLAKILQGQKL